MAQTDRFGLPLLSAGQAHKEVTHNEALMLLNMMVQTVVQSADLSAPPGTPELGQCWIVASGGTGDWIDRDTMVVSWTASGWVVIAPQSGWRAWVLDRDGSMWFDGTLWSDEAVRVDGVYVDDVRVIGPQQAAIASPTGGATQDGEARIAIAAILSALRSHGLIEL